MQWAYAEEDTNGKTNITIGDLNSTASGNVDWSSFEIEGKWATMYLNTRFVLLRNVSTTVTYKIYKKVDGSFVEGDDISGLARKLITDTTMTAAKLALAKWTLSERGDRLRIGKYLY